MPDEPVGKSLLVGENVIHSYAADQCSYGENFCSIFPAYYGGEKAFLVKKTWCSATGYSCSGLKSETILCFKDGVSLLLKEGAYKHLFEK